MLDVEMKMVSLSLVRRHSCLLEVLVTPLVKCLSSPKGKDL